MLWGGEDSFDLPVVMCRVELVEKKHHAHSLVAGTTNKRCRKPLDECDRLPPCPPEFLAELRQGWEHIEKRLSPEVGMFDPGILSNPAAKPVIQ